jgi:hypothetical protein
VLVLFLEPAGLPHFLTTMRRKGVNLTKKGVNLKFSFINLIILQILHQNIVDIASLA